MDAAGQLAQLGQARLQLDLGLVEQRDQPGVGLGAPAGGAQEQGERHQPRLRAVVQVALQPAPLGVARLDDPGTRRAQLLVALAQLGVEVADVASQQPAEERERQERRHDGRRQRGGRCAGRL